MKKMVISLARTPERLNAFRRLNQRPEIQKAEAIDGTKVAKEILVAEGLVSEDLKYSPGALGCAASHIALWQLAFETNETILVLEDDAVLAANFDEALQDLRDELYSYDFLSLGFNLDCPAQFELLPGLTPCLTSFLGQSLGPRVQDFRRLSLKPVPYKLQLCFGTPGYIIRPAGAQKLLRKLLPLRNFTMSCSAGKAVNTGIDVALNSVYQDIEAYVSFPPIVLTANDKDTSTVQGS